MKRARLLLFTALALLATGASAHVTPGPAGGLGAGLWHPFMGIDHVLAMMAVGLLAVYQCPQRPWLLPLVFVSVMALGCLAGSAGASLPYLEIWLSVSVLLLGLSVALRWRGAQPLVVAGIGLFALVHGLAHGTELSGLYELDFIAGALLSTACLHGVGVSTAMLLGGKTASIRSLGILTALAGAGMLMA